MYTYLLSVAPDILMLFQFHLAIMFLYVSGSCSCLIEILVLIITASVPDYVRHQQSECHCNR